MAHRVITVTLPNNNNYQSLYSAIVATTGAVPTDGIFSDKAIWFSISTGLTAISVGSQTQIGSVAAAFEVPINTSKQWGPFTTPVSLKEYSMAGSGAIVRVEVETR